MIDIPSALKKISLFSGLPDDMLTRLATEVQEKQIFAGTTLFREGDPGDALYFILDGQLEISQLMGADREIVLGVFQAGDYFGEMSLLDDKPRSATARTVTDCWLLALNKTDFDNLLDNNPALARRLTRAISDRLRTTSPIKTRLVPQESEPQTPTDAPNVRVFISYSRKDKAFVQQLHDAIRKQGMEAWVDWENIPLTVDWWAEIQRGIENADAFAFVISPDSINSRVCNDEVQAAVDSHKRLIPVLYRDPDNQNPIHPAIGATNWVFMRSEKEMTTHLPEMVRIIRTDLDWVQTHTRLHIRATEWANARRDTSFLLRGADLSNAEQWLTKAEAISDPKPSPLHLDYIFASRQDTRRRNGLLTVGVAISAVILALLVLTFIGFRNASINAEAAISQLNLGATARAEAENQKAEADIQRGIAETQSADGEIQRTYAESQRATAQAESELRATAQADAFFQRDLAISRQHAAQALDFLNRQPDLAALLSIEALKTEHTLEARNALLSVLQQGLSREIVPITPLIPNQRTGIYSVTFSPDGERFAFSQENGTIVIWNLARGALERSFTGHAGRRVWSLAFSPNGKTLASGGDDSFVALWDVDTGAKIQSFPTSNLALSVVWSPDGTRLASVAGPRVIVWRLSDEQRVETNLVFVLNQIAWSPDGTKIAAANRDTIVYLLDADTLDTLQTFGGHVGDVQSVAWAPDSQTLASGGIDSRIMLWDTQSGNLIAELNHHQGIVYGLAFSSDGKILASGSQDQEVALWDVETGNYLSTVKTFDRDVQSVAMSPVAGKIYLAAGSLDKTVSLFEIQLDQPLSEELASALGQVYGLAITSEGDLSALSILENNQLNVWQVNKELYAEAKLLKKITGGSGVESMTLSPDGILAAVGYSTGRIVLTDLQTGETSNYAQTGAPNALAVRPDHLQFASSRCAVYQTDALTPICEEAEILLWNLAEDLPAQTLTGLTSPITALAFSSDGTLLASGDENQTILLWDLATGEPVGIPLIRHQAKITSLAFSPDGRLLASGSADNSIILWDLTSGQPIGEPLAGSSESVWGLVFQPDSKVLYAGNGNGSVYRWEVDDLLWTDLACTLAGRNLSQNEWAQFFIGETYRATCAQFPPGQ